MVRQFQFLSHHLHSTKSSPAIQSKKGAKTDLLVRVRYANPLPPPPFPPRLLHIETNPQRYATYDFLNPLVNERELSLVLDAELGMPLEYGKVAKGEHAAAEYWTGGRSSASVFSGLWGWIGS